MILGKLSEEQNNVHIYLQHQDIPEINNRNIYELTTSSKKIRATGKQDRETIARDKSSTNCKETYATPIPKSHLGRRV